MSIDIFFITICDPRLRLSDCVILREVLLLTQFYGRYKKLSYAIPRDYLL